MVPKFGRRTLLAAGGVAAGAAFLGACESSPAREGARLDPLQLAPMKIVDAQIHIGPDSVETTVAAMDELGIGSVVVDEFWGRKPYGDREFFEPGYTLPNGAWRSRYPTASTAAALYPDRFATVVRVDPRDPDLRTVVREISDTPHTRALRVLPTWAPGDAEAFAAGSCDRLFDLAHEHAVPIFVYAPGYVELLRRYLERVPELSLVIDHCGMAQPGMSGARPADEVARVESIDYFDEVLSFAEYKSVALKWSHEQIAFRSPEFPFEETRPYLRKAIDAFGAERILWASDKTVLPWSWSEILAAVRDNPDLSENERNLILGGTARKILNW
ncbi:amidohydrolase family protein [Nocardia goodfellowii]